MCTAYKERKKIDFNRYPELEAFIMCFDCRNHYDPGNDFKSWIFCTVK